MYRPRIIPVLLLKNNGLVKSLRFKEFTYIGDPMQAVRIFNQLRADELVFLDIEASRENRTISLEMVKNIGEETNMPFSVGGGINAIGQIKDIIASGAERVIINSAALENPLFVKEASDCFGSSTICVCMDVKKNLFGKQMVWNNKKGKFTAYLPEQFAKLIEKNGAGEIVVQSVNRDGTMEGYDLELIKRVAESVSIPVVALGGASDEQDLNDAYQKSHANGLGAGSLFVFQGPKRGVLINYPENPIKIFELNR